MVVAVSRSFDDKPAAIAGIRDVRESAGTALITDLSPRARPAVPYTGVSGAVRRDTPCVVPEISSPVPAMAPPAGSEFFPGSGSLINVGRRA
ncbi:hypothetical protein [Arthrobacter sp. C9C5]|uniref:hypothetical protein n=1 Tax=Arthrobacter sp. C9C5 TaxID=2735267 RepID=UPI0032E0513A